MWKIGGMCNTTTVCVWSREVKPSKVTINSHWSAVMNCCPQKKRLRSINCKARFFKSFVPSRIRIINLIHAVYALFVIKRRDGPVSSVPSSRRFCDVILTLLKPTTTVKKEKLAGELGTLFTSDLKTKILCISVINLWQYFA